ncbi:MAG: tRNA (adenosine(37)-N6)-threonylcarbamoyltransferase complex dimerization subunit type 1 TsaB [Candidatus Merdivicinus sp.]
MKILSLDTSAKTATAAIVEEDRVLAESCVNVGLTHSQTLMPMLEGLLSAACIRLEEIDLFAVSHGPGSFTGIRIGIGAVKGLAQGLGKPCFGVSTLEALAYNFKGLDGFVCPAMDARCGQVYAALYRGAEGALCREQPDEAIAIADLGARLAAVPGPVTLVGDGAELCWRTLAESVPSLRLAPPQLRFQRASSVSFAALAALRKAEPLTPAQLMPVYLRLPQAERELRKKEGQIPN